MVLVDHRNTAIGALSLSVSTYIYTWVKMHASALAHTRAGRSRVQGTLLLELTWLLAAVTKQSHYER